MKVIDKYMQTNFDEAAPEKIARFKEIANKVLQLLPEHLANKAASETRLYFQPIAQAFCMDLNTLLSHGKYIIFISREELDYPEDMQMLCVAHELAHCLLGHVSLSSAEYGELQVPCEIMAEVLAQSILAGDLIKPMTQRESFEKVIRSLAKLNGNDVDAEEPEEGEDAEKLPKAACP